MASIIALLAVAAILGTAAFLVLRPGFGAGPLLPTAGPTPTQIAGASALPSGLGSTPPSAQPSGSGGPGGSIGPSFQPSSEPSVQPSSGPTAPASFSPTTGFTCDPASLFDPTNGRWHLTHVNWGRHPKYDEVTVQLTREGNQARSGSMSIESMDSTEVTSRYGMQAPPENRAIVISFSKAFRDGTIPQTSTGLQAIRDIAVDTDSTGVLRLVLGIQGSGCQQLSVPGWQADPTATVVNALIDVKYQ